MKSFGSGTIAALAGARSAGLVPRDLVWLTVRAFDTGAPSSFGLWSGDDTLDIAVISGTTGAPVTRTYIGGVNLDVGEIVETADLTVQAIDISLSAIAPTVQAIARGYDTRLASVEIHSLMLDPATRLPVDEAEIMFLGAIDDAPMPTAAAGGESVMKFTAIDDGMLMLTRTSAAKRSDERQQGRDGDRLNRYSNVVGNWQVFWGDTAQGGGA